MTLQFTDISGDGNQPANPDFIKARDLGGIDGSWLKASGGGGPRGYINPDLATQEAAILAAGLPEGLYHLCNEPKHPQVGPKAEAEFFHSVCGARDVPICLDWEYDGWTQQDGLIFLTRLEELRNRTPWVYLNEYFSNRYGVTDPAYARYPLWLASWVYGNNPPDPPGLPRPLFAWRNAPGQPLMWQFTSQARVPGIGAVDKNLFFGTAADFRNSGKATAPPFQHAEGWLDPLIDRFDWTQDGTEGAGIITYRKVRAYNDETGVLFEREWEASTGFTPWLEVK